MQTEGEYLYEKIKEDFSKDYLNLNLHLKKLNENVNAIFQCVDILKKFILFNAKDLRKLFDIKIKDIEFSVRTTNCLNQANINTIGQLVCFFEPDLLKFPNFGKKSLNEIKAKLEEMGLFLGMRVTDPNPEDVTKLVIGTQEP